MLIYCDSAIIIYYYEHTGPFKVRAIQRLMTLRAAGDQMVMRIQRGAGLVIEKGAT